MAAGGADGARACAALETLCAAYWFPLYAYARRRGIPREDARDSVQALFARLLEKDGLALARPERGRFRSFLLGALRHWLANEWDRERAQKRGGGAAPIALDLESAEQRLELADRRELTPEQHYDRAWAIEQLERSLATLRGEYASRGQADLFEALAPTLTAGGDAESYAAIAARLGTSEAAIQVAAHRLRARYRETLRAEIASTLADPAAVDDELAALRTAFSS